MSLLLHVSLGVKEKGRHGDGEERPRKAVALDDPRALPEERDHNASNGRHRKHRRIQLNNELDHGLGEAEPAQNHNQEELVQRWERLREVEAHRDRRFLHRVRLSAVPPRFQVHLQDVVPKVPPPHEASLGEWDDLRQRLLQRHVHRGREDLARTIAQAQHANL
eukprot:4081226-Pyramimonas_sp.AAC.1